MVPAPLIPFLLTLPWVMVLGFLLFLVKIPRELPAGRAGPDAPPVSVIIPARNEALNIEACVESVAASRYGDFEIIVVDDRSEDGTGELARGLSPGNASSLRVVEGADLPEGWLGKPWACAQGAAVATGDLLLFTDADTTHGVDLLGRAVQGMQEDEADLITILGRQLMETFWEKLVQPHVFLMMLFRYPDFESLGKRGHWRDAIANGQYMLFRRDAYDELGGHEAVRRQVVEDQALAQLVKRQGRVISIRSAEHDFATRMYRSLGDLVQGWSKNIVLGGKASLPPLLRPVMVPATVLTAVGLWLAPPVCLMLALAGMGGGGLLAWSFGAVAISVIVYGLFTSQMGGPWAYGLIYPLGVTVNMYIVTRAWIRGSRVEWKGREYRLDAREGAP